MFGKEFSREDFEQKLKENPANDHLKTVITESQKTETLAEEKPDSITLAIGFSEHPAFYDKELNDRFTDLSFALGNKLLGVLDEKQHRERENEDNHVGWYHKTDFEIHAVIGGEEFNYEGRFDIGDGEGDLTAHIRNFYEYSLSPESIRALLIHSAVWTDEMIRTFIPSKPTKNDYRNLIRVCGYGVPDLERAIYSAQNSVNLIIEDELQPFVKKSSGSITSNEMHMHDIPWPTGILKNLGENKVKMRVTLSYYIEPGPGQIGWKDKYRYPSCGLLFDVNNPTESKEEFKKRISKAMRDEDEKSIVSNDSGRWLIGSQNRNVGSIHSDIWEGTAVDLSQSNYIMIYPTTGWWKLRTNQKKYNNRVRYSLVVSIETPENNVNLYNEITTAIRNKAVVKTEITAISKKKENNGR